jgi:hypothetical protein
MIGEVSLRLSCDLGWFDETYVDALFAQLLLNSLLSCLPSQYSDCLWAEVLSHCVPLRWHQGRKH